MDNNSNLVSVRQATFKEIQRKGTQSVLMCESGAGISSFPIADQYLPQFRGREGQPVELDLIVRWSNEKDDTTHQHA